MNEQLCQIWRPCAPPFFCYLRKTDRGGHICAPPAVRGLTRTLWDTLWQRYGAPEPPKLNSAGSKIGSTHHTRLRVGLSHLHAHMFQIQLTPSPACPCGYIQEDTAHYILWCPLYTYHRSQLFIKMRRIIPDFDNLSSKCKLSTLLFGINLTTKQGIRVAYHLQSYIGLTHRFNM